MTTNILIENDSHHFAKIILNKPEKNNAFDDETIRQLKTALQALAKNSQLRALLLIANGKHFCSGADLQWMQRMVKYSEEENYQDAMQLAEILQTLNEMPMPVVTLIQGACYGGGIGLAACSDIVIATDNAQFCFSEVKLGLAPATISPYVIAKIGETAARRYFLTAEKFSAADAWHMGLVHQVVTTEQLAEAGQTFISQILMNAPQAVRIAKQLIQRRQSNFELAKLIAQLRASTEGQEGLKAFFEKRKPNWNI